MRDQSPAASAEEMLLMQFVGDLEARGSVALEEYVRWYPHLRKSFREVVRLRCLLSFSEGDPGPSVPPQLEDFVLGRLMARGGMGEVYEATRAGSGERAAVKILRRGSVSPEALDRFRREQEVVRRLRRRHIVPVLRAGEQGPFHFLAMPYIEGASLNRVVRTAWDCVVNGGQLPPLVELAQRLAGATEEWQSQASPLPKGDGAKQITQSVNYIRSVATVVAEVAEALADVHAAGILHRDIKPSNIMIDTTGGSFLIDFGLAKWRDASEEDSGVDQSGPSLPSTHATGGASGIMGTPEYMAPEQFRKRGDERTDVWALGVTLYQALTLRRPFWGANVAEVRNMVECGQPCSPDVLVDSLPRALSAICRKALEKNPVHRHDSAQAFAKELRHWLTGTPTRPPSVSFLGRVRQWVHHGRHGSTTTPTLTSKE